MLFHPFMWFLLPQRVSPQMSHKKLAVLGIFAQGIADHFCFQITGLGSPRLQILLDQLCHFGIMWWDDLSAIAPVEFISLDFKDTANKTKVNKPHSDLGKGSMVEICSYLGSLLLDLTSVAPICPIPNLGPRVHCLLQDCAKQ